MSMTALRQPEPGVPGRYWQLIGLPRLTSLSKTACNRYFQAPRRNLSPPNNAGVLHEQQIDAAQQLPFRLYILQQRLHRRQSAFPDNSLARDVSTLNVIVRHQSQFFLAYLQMT